MDARVKGDVGLSFGHGGGCGCWGRATVAAATTTVTLRCAGRDRRTVFGRELPRTRVASRNRIDQSRVLRTVAAVAQPQRAEGWSAQAVACWARGWSVAAAQRKAASSRATATVATVERLPRSVRCL